MLLRFGLFVLVHTNAFHDFFNMFKFLFCFSILSNHLEVVREEALPMPLKPLPNPDKKGYIPKLCFLTTPIFSLSLSHFTYA